MRKLLRVFTPGICLALLAAAPLQAQQSTTRGFNVGLDFGATGISFENSDTDSGANGGIRVGYGLNRIVTLYAAFQGATLDIQNFTQFENITVGHVDLGVRLHLANSRRGWVPYGDVALTPRIVSADVIDGTEVRSAEFSGAAITLGGGLALYLTESWAMDLNLKWSGGEFTEVDLGSVALQNLDIDSQSGRFTIGLTWWP